MDCLAQSWVNLLESLNYCPILLPASLSESEDYLTQLQIDALILSGGNSIADRTPVLADADPQRDAHEKGLINFCKKRKLPLIGICRGFQLLNFTSSGQLLHAIKNHAGCNHKLVLSKSGKDIFGDAVHEVNSYHNLGLYVEQLHEEWEFLAKTEDGIVEAFKHSSYPILAIQWHPERDEWHTPANTAIWNWLENTLDTES